jgi:hypothetical protein
MTIQEQIRSSPHLPETYGRIRAELGIIVPKDIRGNVDAVIAVVESARPPAPPPPPPPPVKKRGPYIATATINVQVSGTTSWTRQDRVKVSMEIPEDVVQDATEDDDESIIDDYILAHWQDGEETDRHYGDQNDMDTDQCR